MRGEDNENIFFSRREKADKVAITAKKSNGDRNGVRLVTNGDKARRRFGL